VKELWLREVAHMHKLVTQMQKAHSTYVKCQQEWEQVHEESQKTDQSAQGKLDRRKITNDEAMQKVRIAILLIYSNTSKMLRCTSTLFQATESYILVVLNTKR
jgi:hypothetical protein